MNIFEKFLTKKTPKRHEILNKAHEFGIILQKMCFDLAEDEVLFNRDGGTPLPPDWSDVRNTLANKLYREVIHEMIHTRHDTGYWTDSPEVVTENILKELVGNKVSGCLHVRAIDWNEHKLCVIRTKEKSFQVGDYEHTISKGSQRIVIDETLDEEQT